MERLNEERKEQSKPVRWVQLADGTSVLRQAEGTGSHRILAEFAHLHAKVGIPQRWAIHSLQSAVRGWIVR